MKKIMTFITAILLSMMLVLPVSAHPSRLVDDADLLTVEEEENLLFELNALSEEIQFDIVVVAVDSLDGKSAEAYADDYFDYNGYGMGETYDGALFLISMEERQWHISTCGYGLQAISDSDLYYMEDEIVPYLSSGEYLEAFETFAWMANSCVKEALETGNTAHVVVEEGHAWGKGIFLSLGIGFVAAFIPMLVMKGKMKTVTARSEATEYLQHETKRITRSHDRFLYHTINRVYTPEQDTSTSHMSSSGRSHGGRGGSF